MHKNQNDFFCCVKGKIKLVLVDVRENSKTKSEINEFEIGEGGFSLVGIPKQVLHAFKSLKGESIVLNCIDREYNKENPDEIRVKNIYYNWDKV